MPARRRSPTGYGTYTGPSGDLGLGEGFEGSLPGPVDIDFGGLDPGKVSDPSYTPRDTEVGGAAGTPAPTTSTTKYATTGFDPAKYGTSSTSPKYAFRSIFETAAPGTGEDAFKRLQAEFPDYFKDWSMSGDKIRYTGSGGPHADFDGLTEFDIQVDEEGGGPWAWQPTYAGGYRDPVPGAPPGLFGSSVPGAGGGFGGGSSSGGSSTRPMFGGEVMDQLRGLFPGGAFNQDIVNRRTELASENLGRQRKSRDASNRAALASRGLIGSGPEITAVDRMEGDLYDQYANAVSGIYADESENADSRMIQALMTAAGLTESEARIALERELGYGNIGLGYRNADINERLGLGNLALGNYRAQNDYSLGSGRLGLDRDVASAGIDDASTGRLIQLIQLYLQGAGQSAGGYR